MILTAKICKLLTIYTPSPNTLVVVIFYCAAPVLNLSFGLRLQICSTKLNYNFPPENIWNILYIVQMSKVYTQN